MRVCLTQQGTRPTAILLGLLCLLALAPANAQRAALVFEADSGLVLRATNPHRLSYPASLTKLMTLYLLFDAIQNKQLSTTDTLVVSAAAAAQPPKSMRLKAGDTISVETALLALIVFSANDVSVVVAEAVAGTETEFVQHMNRQSMRLNMTATRFKNASGLPHPEQITTAHDMALLVTALHQEFPGFFRHFARAEFNYRKRRYAGHNNFLNSYRDANGLKTGFTCRAGYNLAASVKRGGRTLMGIILGSPTPGGRDAEMVRLFNLAFKQSTTGAPTLHQLEPTPGPDDSVNRGFIADECINPRRAGTLHVAAGWSLEFTLEVEKQAAIAQARRFIRSNRQTLAGGRPLLIPRWARDIIYRVGVTGLAQSNATATCLAVRVEGGHCIVLPPKTAEVAINQAMATLAWMAKRAPEP